ncbi:MAG: GspE/PulE family protein [Candidatus Krumholzibacteriia bacterium]
MTQPISKDVLALIPARFVEKYRIVPLGLHGDRLVVAHPQGMDPTALHELSLLLNMEVDGEGRGEAELQELIRVNYGLGAQAIESLIKGEREEGRRLGPALAASPLAEELDTSSDDAAIVSFVNHLLLQAYRDNATDIHIEPFDAGLAIRYRLDGFLHDVPVPAEVHRFHAAIVSRIKVMADLNIGEHRLPQDGRIKAKIDGQELDFRVSILPTHYGEGVNLRLLVNTSIQGGLEALGLHAEGVEIVQRLLRKPHGVVLVTGPTGSGKTTTLYTFLNLLNEVRRKIITIEDPIEYTLQRISQIQVHPKIGLGFAEGLRSMLRHDPDVMMVGEIRDHETAETVIRVALTGHLVFSTVHTNDAPSTPARLLDMGIEPYLLTSSVECILAQRLVRLVCPSCAVPAEAELAPGALGVSEEACARISAGTEQAFARGVGCGHCRSTGYKGRTAIFEVMPVTPGLREVIVARGSAAELAQIAVREGFWPLRWRGLQLAARGRTTVEEVLRVTAAESGG